MLLWIEEIFPNGFFLQLTTPSPLPIVNPEDIENEDVVMGLSLTYVIISNINYSWMEKKS